MTISPTIGHRSKLDDMGSKRLSAIDLFCGVGGMSLGFEQAGWDIRAAYDSDRRNTEGYNRNSSSNVGHTADLSIETGDSLRKMAKLGTRKIDLVFGGPPCQGFSVGGTRNLRDDRNKLVFHFGRLVRELKPRYFVMENVQGLTYAPARSVLNRFLREMRKAGYCFTEPPKVLDAANFGVPQRRRRLFVLGWLAGESPVSYPEPQGIRLPLGQFSPVVRDAIADLPDIELHEEFYSSDTFNGSLRRTTSAYAKLMRGELKDSSDHSVRRLPRELTGCLRTRHSRTSARRFARTTPGQSEPVSRYFRLSWDGIAPTIRAGTDKDRGK